MPKKPRRGKAFQAKKKKSRQPTVTVSAESTATAPVKTPQAPIVSATVTKIRKPVVKYPFVTAELRRIGIIAGAILVILIVLALVL